MEFEIRSRPAEWIRGGSVALIGFFVMVHAQERVPGELSDPAKRKWHEHAKALPGARQAGVGCAFYANVPALTLVSGINVVDESRDSRAFITGVYGLRRGDFLMRSAFDKEILSLNSYQIGARESLPVWFIDQRPCVVTGYAQPAGEKESTLTISDGAASRVLPLSEALAAIRASGSLVGYAEVPRR